MKLTDTAIRNAKPGLTPAGKTTTKPYKMSDGGGMYLEVTPTGSKLWRLKYRISGKEKRISFGPYPEVSLKSARNKREEARTLLAEGEDPSENRKSQKRAKAAAVEDTFEAVAREWFCKQEKGWSKSHAARTFGRLEANVFKWIGDRPIREITARELLEVLRRIEDRGAYETAHRTRATCGQVFRYAIVTGKAERDVAADLRGALTPVNPTHFPTITDPKEIGRLLNAIDAYRGSNISKFALRLLALTFVRPGELRHAEWSEIDLETAEWRIPAGKMKSKKPHVVPLSNQAVALLKELRIVTGHTRFLFPGERSVTRPMSENTVNAALRRMGYTKQEFTGHGFRSMASTLANENGKNRDVIERQLAHADRDTTRAAYNHAEYLPDRVKLIQWWADFLDECREIT